MRALMLSLAFSGCLEIVEHTPAGACSADHDCPCGHECYPPDGSVISMCGAARHVTCIDNHACSTPATCQHVVRDGGVCPNSYCR
jgi:hypothetical protein